MHLLHLFKHYKSFLHLHRLLFFNQHLFIKFVNYPTFQSFPLSSISIKALNLLILFTFFLPHFLYLKSLKLPIRNALSRFEYLNLFYLIISKMCSIIPNNLWESHNNNDAILIDIFNLIQLYAPTYLQQHQLKHSLNFHLLYSSLSQNGLKLLTLMLLRAMVKTSRL